MLPQFSKDKTVNFFAHLLTALLHPRPWRVRQTGFSLARMARSEQGALKRTVSEGCCVRRGPSVYARAGSLPKRSGGGGNHGSAATTGLGRQPRRRRRRRAKSPAGTCVFCAETCRRSCVSA